MTETTLWCDKKRYLGLPISFTKYRVTETRIFIETGLLNLREEEILLYKVRDIYLTRSLGQRIFGVGTIHIYADDKTSAKLAITNVKIPKDVKELIFEHVEKAKASRGMNVTEFVGN